MLRLARSARSTEDSRIMKVDPQIHKSADELIGQRFNMLEDIAQELAGNISFPVCFDLAIRLRTALRKDSVSFGELTRMIRLEPLLSARLLGLANAATGGDGKPVVGVETAIVRLGSDVARDTAVSVSHAQLLRSRNLVVFSDLSESLWAHSLRTAAGARVIARRMTSFDPDEAMTAGLMCDLGAFYMLYRASQYEELRIRPDSARHLIARWQGAIGESLMVALGLPEQIIAAVRDDGVPRTLVSSPRSLNELVFVSRLLAGDPFLPFDADGEVPTVRLEMTYGPYLALIDEIDHEYQDLRRVLET